MDAGMAMKVSAAVIVMLAGLVAGPPAAPFPQGLQHSTGTVNVEVPVRVFDGDRFVDDLAAPDFEVFEDGRPQRIAALYLVRKRGLEKKTVPAPPAGDVPEPPPGRTIVLQFQLIEPNPKIDEALAVFAAEVLRPDDDLTVVTPRAAYVFAPGARAGRPGPELAREMQSKVRRDLVAAGAEFRRLTGDLQDIERSPMDPDEKLQLMSEVHRQMSDRVGIDRRAMRRMAQALKAREGPKFLFLFYEPETVRTMRLGDFGDGSLPSAEGQLDDMASTEARRLPTVNAAEIARAFSDASVTVHFIYLTRPGRNAAGLDVEKQRPEAGGATRDLSAAFFAAFREMAQVTGGVSTSSANALAGFRTAAAATENYYLLYYAPEGYRPDGRFREIRVRIKRPGYRVWHRAGYFAN